MNTQPMNITLSSQPADARWGEKALLSSNDNGMTLHLREADALMTIQRAARKLDGQGIRHVSLAGEGWHLEQCWAFWQGYRGPKGKNQVDWPQLGEHEQAEFDRRRKIVGWVRDTINLPADDLGPETLAHSAIDLLSELGGEAVSYRITKGDDLREQGYMGLHTVGRGSNRPPVFLALDFNPPETARRLFTPVWWAKALPLIRRLQPETERWHGLNEVGHGRRGHRHRCAGAGDRARAE